MKFFVIVISLIPILCIGQSGNYLNYHKEIIRAEEYIAARQFGESIRIYRNLADTYEHVFLRDIKIAAQLSAFINDSDNLFYFLEKGMKKDWTLKEIMKIKILKKFKEDNRWQKLIANQEKLKKEFKNSINLELRAEIREMFSEDQKRAIRVALTPLKSWRDRYTNKKFVPNNRLQVKRINQIIDQVGYPGEKIIGDKSWATVIISHNEHDTIYNELRPKLYQALKLGELSAIDLAIIETWRMVVDTDRKEKGFVIWNEEINKSDAVKADSLPFHGGIIKVKD